MMSSSESDEEDDDVFHQLHQTVVYYQCKNCSKILVSSSKWESHLSKCLVVLTGGGGGAKKPIGFRLMTFKSPVVVIEGRCDDSNNKVGVGAIHLKKKNNVKFQEEGHGGGESSTRAHNAGAGAGGGNTERVLQRCSSRRRRKSAQNAREKLHSICSEMGEEGEEEDSSLISTTPKKGNGDTTSRKRRTSTTTMKTQNNIKGDKKRSKRPRHVPSGDDDDDDPDASSSGDEEERRLAKKKKEKAAALNSKTYYQRSSSGQTDLTFHPSCDRRYNKFECPLCPGKFPLKTWLKSHVDKVHNGTRTMTPCAVCGRVFNRRNSLNAHILAHEAAEAREAKFSLLQPWGPDLLEYLQRVRVNYDKNGVNKCFAVYQTCKFCLLTQCSYPNFIAHIVEEHTGAEPESYQFHCRFTSCDEAEVNFGTISELVEHVKARHPKFRGRLEQVRHSKGVYTGWRRVPRDEHGRACSRAVEAKTYTYTKLSSQQQPIISPKRAKRMGKRWKPKKPIRSTKVKKMEGSYEKPVKSFTPLQEPVSSSDEDDESSGDGDGGDDDGSDWEREFRDSIRHIPKVGSVKAKKYDRSAPPEEKRIELESVSVDEQGRVEPLAAAALPVKREVKTEVVEQQFVTLGGGGDNNDILPPNPPEVVVVVKHIQAESQSQEFIIIKTEEETEEKQLVPVPAVLPPHPHESKTEHSDSDAGESDDEEEKPIPKPTKSTARRLVINWQWRKGKHVCPICSLNFATRVSLATHHSSHHDLGDNCNDTNEAPHPCGSCSAYFLTENQLARHKELFHRIARDSGAPLNPTQVERMALKAAKKHVCPICNLNFATPHTLATHHSSHHDLDNNASEPSSKALVCGATNCPAYFLTGHQLARHKEQFHGISRQGPHAAATAMKPLKVVAPLKAVKTRWRRRKKVAEEVVRGQRQRLQVGGSQCRVCKIRYYSRGTLRRHYKASHGGVRKEASLHCDVPGCSAYFRTQHQLTHHKTRVHLIIPSRARPQPQGEDDDVVVNSDNINTKSDGGPPPDPLDPDAVFKCNLPNCTALFASIHQLETHLERLHTRLCRICGAEFTTNTSLRRHRYGVHKKDLVLRFACGVEDCGREFEHEEEVRWHHDRKHTTTMEKLKVVDLTQTPSKVVAEVKKKKKEAVKQPQQEQSANGGLSRKKPRKQNLVNASLPAHVCGKTFADKYRLQRHLMMSHSDRCSGDEWPFTCPFCSRKCSSKQTQLEHERTHTGEKFLCGVCGAGYVSKHQMRYHKMKKHPEIDPD